MCEMCVSSRVRIGGRNVGEGVGVGVWVLS